MCKKVASIVMVIMAIFCYWGPIQGGQADEIVIPVYKKTPEIRQSMSRSQQVNTSRSSPVTVCKASWYGPGFHGRPTASGEIFDQDSMTAAHKRLPFGTKILVTNLNNGKSTVVTINDRGPFIEGRELDLSRAAAVDIDMINAGVVNVTMKIIK